MGRAVLMVRCNEHILVEQFHTVVVTWWGETGTKRTKVSKLQPANRKVWLNNSCGGGV